MRFLLLGSSAVLSGFWPMAASSQQADAQATTGATQGSAVDGLQLEAIDVQGPGALNAGTGPVNGYVAKDTTTGSRTATPIIQIPQSVSVIGREEMTDRDVQKVDEALRYTPGVFTQPFGYDSDTDWLYIRGFDATQTGMFLDNMQLYSYAFGGFTIDPFLLERVEVLRGASSALYGSSNPGGIVNMVSRRPTGERIRYVEGAISADPNGQGAFDIGDRIDPEGKWSYRILGKIKGGDTQVDYAEQFRGLIAPMVSFRPDDVTDLTLYANYQYDDLKHTNGFFPYVGSVVPAPFGRISRDFFYSEPDSDTLKAHQTMAGYEFETEVFDGIKLSSNTRYAHLNKSEYGPYLYGYYDPATGFGGLMEPVSPDYLLNRLNFSESSVVNTVTSDNNATVEFATGPVAHTLLAGIDYKFYQIDQSQAVGSAPPISPINPVYTNSLPDLWAPYVDETIDMNQIGGYLQDQMRFGGGWITTLNGRYDYVWINRDDHTAADIDYSGRRGAFSGRAGLGYEFSNGLVPYVSAASFFNPQIGTDASGQALPPQTGEQYEIGLKWSPSFVDALFTVALFDLTRRNMVQSVAPLYIPQTIGETRSRGVEFEANANITKELKLVGAFTAYDLQIRNDADAALIGNQPYLVPEVMASLWLDYTIGDGDLKGLGFGAGVRYVGASYADNENTLSVPAATVFDAAVRYDRDNWGVALNVNNVFDEDYVAGCQTALSCGYGQGRSAILKAHFTW